MREIKITIDTNKKIKTNNTKLGNKWDNAVSKLIFIIPEEYNLTYKYVVFENENLTNTIMFPINSVDNSMVITTAITQHSGQWGLTFLATEYEIIDGDINNASLVAVSDTIYMSITDNAITDPQPNAGVDKNLQVIYDDMQNTVIYLNSDEFKNSVRGEIGPVGPVGPKGDKGDSIVGPVGPIGPKGDTGNTGATGNDGYTPIRGTDYWTNTDISTIESYCNNYIDTVIVGGVS